MTDRSFMEHQKQKIMKSKIWFITGASKGFGFDIAKTALESGDYVVATVRKDAEQLSSKLGNPERLLVVTLDVTDGAQVKAGVQAAIERFERIDVLVNNAGYGLLAAIEEASAVEIKKQYDTNVFGLLNVTKAVLPQMRKQASGHIINISSLYGYQNTVPGFALYGSTKFAVEGISEGLATEVKAFGIRVTAVAPGLFSTDFASTDSYQNPSILLDAYQDTVGAVRGRMKHFDGNQPGDPSKLAGVIIELAASENPPLHLPIGSDAIKNLRDKITKISAEVQEWESLASSTDHSA